MQAALVSPSVPNVETIRHGKISRFVSVTFFMLTSIWKGVSHVVRVSDRRTPTRSVMLVESDIQGYVWGILPWL